MQKFNFVWSYSRIRVTLVDVQSGTIIGPSSCILLGSFVALCKWCWRREGIDKHIFQFLLNIYIRDDAGFECQDAFIWICLISLSVTISISGLPNIANLMMSDMVWMFSINCFLVLRKSLVFISSFCSTSF